MLLTSSDMFLFNSFIILAKPFWTIVVQDVHAELVTLSLNILKWLNILVLLATFLKVPVSLYYLVQKRKILLQIS